MNKSSTIIENNLVERDLMAEVLRWMKRPEVIAIKGPRQAGKTTFLKMLADKLKQNGVERGQIKIINFEKRARLEQYEKDPIGLVKSFITDDDRRQYLFLDEYQYVEGGGQKLKLVYDTFGKQVKLVITGSSSLELASKTAEYMVGRMLSGYLFPLSFGEFLKFKDERLYKLWENKHGLVEDFLFKRRDIELKKDIFVNEILDEWRQYVKYGGYPAVVTETNLKLKKTLLDNLINTYVDRDIVRLVSRRDVASFGDLTRLASVQTGRLLNYQQLSNDLGLYYKKVKDFLNILEETFLIKQIRPLHGNLTTELKKNPKLFWLDSGLRNQFLGNFSDLKMRADKGEIVESVVMSNLFDQKENQDEVLFWRTKAGAEVDFIIRRGEQLFPIEVKYRTLKQPKLGKSLISYIKSYQPERVVVATRDFWGRRDFEGAKILFSPVVYV